MEISAKNRKLYADKSVPEYVTMTVLALSGDKMVGCEGNEWDICQACKIKKVCYLRTMYVFAGGKV